MPALNTITPNKLARLIATLESPLLLDLRDNPHEVISGLILRSQAGPIKLQPADARKSIISMQKWIVLQ
jgi:hypothetical protein